MNDTQNFMFAKISMFIITHKKIKTRVLLLAMMEELETDLPSCHKQLEKWVKYTQTVFRHWPIGSTGPSCLRKGKLTR